MPFPLSAVLGLQVLVVVAAFVAVVTVLSEQQRSEFQDALYSRLRHQHASSLQRIVMPLLERSVTFDRLVTAYTNGHNGDGAFVGPNDEPGGTTLARAQVFYDHFYVLVEEDPLIRIISISNVSSTYWAPNHKNRTALELSLGVQMPDGSYRMPRSWLADRTKIYNLFAIDSVKSVAVTKEMASACYGPSGYPTITHPCVSPAFKINQAFDTAESVGPTGWADGPRWGVPTPLNDRSVAGEDTPQIFSYSRHFGGATAHPFLLSASFAMPHVKPLIRNNTAHATSRAAVFGRYPPVGNAPSFDYFIAGQVDFPDYDTPIISITEEHLDGTWEGGSTPDATLNAAFEVARPMFINATDSAIREMSHGGEDYIVSISRYYEPAVSFDWLYVEYTPREVFFRDSDRARLAGILIGAAGCVVVLAVCIAVWFSVRLPLLHLAKNMDLAADLRNDEVVHGSSGPLLTEIADVSMCFKEMNAKLLAAIPFLPPSLLVRRGFESNSDESPRDDDDEEGEGGEDGGGGVIGGGDSSTRDDRELGAYASTTGTSATESRVGGDGNTDSTIRSSVGGLRGASTAHPFATNGPRRVAHSGARIVTVGSGSGAAAGTSGGGVGASRPYQRTIALRRVGVLVVNVLNFHGAASLGGGGGGGGITSSSNNAVKGLGAGGGLSVAAVTNILALHAKLARLVEQSVTEQRGIIDSFHGDRFVCGFNTVRMCGNAARNGAEAAVKLWSRFCASPQLVEAFPQGLSMGLAVGRAAVGNHGTDTMQRLATIGPVYTEAVRLQEVMSRRVLGGALRAAAGDSQRLNPSSSSGSSLPPPSLIAGRCLVMGRVVQDIATSSSAVHCQIVGAVPAVHFFSSIAAPSASSSSGAAAGGGACGRPSSFIGSRNNNNNSSANAMLAQIKDAVNHYARTRNEGVMLLGGDDAAADGDVGPQSCGRAAATAAASVSSVLVAVVAARGAASALTAAYEEEAVAGEGDGVDVFGAGGAAAAAISDHIPITIAASAALPSYSGDDRPLPLDGVPSPRCHAPLLPGANPTAYVAVSNNTAASTATGSTTATHNTRTNTLTRKAVDAILDDADDDGVGVEGALLGGEEWLYQLNSEGNACPFAAPNTALYRLWRDGINISGGGAVADGATGGGGGSPSVSSMHSRHFHLPLVPLGARWAAYVRGVLMAGGGVEESGAAVNANNANIHSSGKSPTVAAPTVLMERMTYRAHD